MMNSHQLGKLLVALQFGLLAAMAALCMPHATEQAPGLSSWWLWLASVALGLWTLSTNHPGNFNIRPEPKAQGHLVTTGPYRWVRHPMYGSVLLLAAGASAWLMNLTGAVLWLALLGVLIAKAYLEERWLVQRYPQYAEYQRSTWRLVPGVY
jgi:protein-S-isoprenylcysteine O-methyltransferase Ste14